MEILATSINWLVLAGAGLLAGFIDAIVGGGGLLSIPALLSVGMPAHLSLGTNKLASSMSSSTAAYTYYKKHLFDPRLWKKCFIATAVGAVVGSVLVYLIDGDLLEKILPVIVILVALYSLLFRKVLHGEFHPPKHRPRTKRQLLQGFILGSYDGFAGPGLGSMWIVSSRVLYKLSFLKSCALSRAMTFVSNIVALAIFIYHGNVDFAVGLLLGSSMMLGSYIGTHSAIRFGLPFIRPLFITMVIIIAIHLSWNAWT
ncbi:TSUP family transporter [Shewanella sp. A3A]|uniref:Probable membrane transporter protein n=1 Tax=Shewanella electrica TaxID=515560 RepID=A0ABT2FH12_9GAMM|nr:TSUP family transporter [Shewanella electrica]MCH1919323.1 TSUP family transporter [Shewanella ferrihydritica]MCH1923436.1 TSUP family transporter [Shewanella electrica]MCS4555533.1 TSUP family transporter [Shewanella electrica]